MLNLYSTIPHTRDWNREGTKLVSFLALWILIQVSWSLVSFFEKNKELCSGNADILFALGPMQREERRRHKPGNELEGKGEDVTVP
jgi:hypothetical protein